MASLLVDIPDVLLAKLDSITGAHNEVPRKRQLTKDERAEAARLAKTMGHDAAVLWINSIIGERESHYSRRKLVIQLIELGLLALPNPLPVRRTLSPVEQLLLERVNQNQLRAGYKPAEL